MNFYRLFLPVILLVNLHTSFSEEEAIIAVCDPLDLSERPYILTKTETVLAPGVISGSGATCSIGSDGTITTSGNLVVSGTAAIGSNMAVDSSGNIVASGLLLSGSLTGTSANLSGPLNVVGAATVTSLVTAQNGLSVSGVLTGASEFLSGNLNVSGATTVTGPVAANNGLSVSGNLTGAAAAFSGTVTVSGVLKAASFNILSTQYAKTAIQNISPEDSKKIRNLRPVLFSYVEDPEKIHYGLIAEEVKLLFSHLVSDEENPGISYTELIPLLIMELNEQETKIEELERRICIVEQK